MSSATFIDPRLSTSVTPSFYRYKGVENYQVYDIPASSLSDSLITFSNMTTLGRNMLYLDDLCLSYTIRFNFNVLVVAPFTPVGDVYSIPSNPPPKWISVRPFPLSNCMTTVNTIINGIQAASYPRDTLQLQGQMRNAARMAPRLDDTCPYASPTETFAPRRFDSLNPTKKGTIFTTIPSVYDMAVPRPDETTGNIRQFTNVGTEILINESSEGFVPMSFTFSAFEPLLCCPFNQNLASHFPKPVWGIENMEIRVWLSQLHRMLNMSSVFNYGSKYVDPETGVERPQDIRISATFVSAIVEKCSLRYGVITAPPEMPIPPIFFSPITQYIPLITNIEGALNTKPTGSYEQVTSNIFTFTSVPQAIYLYVGRSTLSWDNVGSSCLENFEIMPIENIDITMGNNTKIMYTLRPEDLAFISRKNGVRMSSSQWLGKLPLGIHDPQDAYQRGILALIPGIDIVIPGETLVPGTPASFGDGGKMTFQATARFKVMPTDYTGNWSFFIFFQNIGTYSLSGSSGSIDMIPLGAEGGMRGGGPVIDVAEVDEMYGGGLMDSIGNALKSVWNSGIISKGLSMIPHPIARGIGGVVGALGGGGVTMGGGYPPRKKMLGGAPLPKDYFL